MPGPSSSALVVALAICLVLSCAFAPRADALLVEQLQTVQTLVNTLFRGALGDLQRIFNDADRATTFLRTILQREPESLGSKVAKQQKRYEREFDRQMKSAIKATATDTGYLERNYAKQIRAAERSFRKQQREAEKLAADAEQARARASRQRERAAVVGGVEYDAKKIDREIAQQRRAYERALRKMKRASEKARREFNKNRRPAN